MLKECFGLLMSVMIVFRNIDHAMCIPKPRTGCSHKNIFCVIIVTLLSCHHLCCNFACLLQTCLHNCAIPALKLIDQFQVSTHSAYFQHNVMHKSAIHSRCSCGCFSLLTRGT